MFITPIKFSDIILTCIVTILVLIIVWFINNIGVTMPINPRSYHFVFNNVAGVAINDSIKIAGLSIGNIKQINFIKQSILITIELPHNVVLYKNSKAIIKSKSLLGEKFLEISMGYKHHVILINNTIIIHNYPTLDINQVLQEIGILCTRLNLFLDTIYILIP